MPWLRGGGGLPWIDVDTDSVVIRMLIGWAASKLAETKGLGPIDCRSVLVASGQTI